MLEFLIGTACFLAGAAAVFFLMRHFADPAGKAELREELASSRSSAEAFRQQADSEKQLLLQGFEKEKSMLAARYEEKIRYQADQYEERLTFQKEQFQSETAVLKQALEDVKKQFHLSLEEINRNHEERIRLMKDEFKTLSDAVLTEKSGKLHEENRKQLEAVLTPLGEKMTAFRSAVEESRERNAAMNASLKVQLEKMMEETNRIGGEARDLVRALRGEQKTQGDWGEFILEALLKDSGLVRGEHYECQETLCDQDGKVLHNEESRQRMRPDVILHYPDRKDLIIDSKVSLTAYADYMNAADEETRKNAVQRHLRSIRSHVEELARKDYAAYQKESGRDTVDFVIMFVPHEGPYHLAMISDPGLWNEAFRKKVLIVTPVNLMALLKIIHIAWTREEQDRNRRKILECASELLDRLYAFYQIFDELGDAIGKTEKKFEEAAGKLKQEGRNRSVVLSGEKLRSLGVRFSKGKVQEIPSRLQPDLFPAEAVVAEENTGNDA